MDFLCVESEEKETIWIGDPAVDVDASDIDNWVKTGEGIRILPQQKATKIRYREVAPVERRQASIHARMIKKNAPMESDNALRYKFIEELARFGLVAIEGHSMERELYDGTRGIGYEAWRKLSWIRISDPMPDGSPMNPALEPWKGLEFLWWLGGLISADLFRRG